MSINLLVYRIADDEFMLVVNGANIDKDWQWCVDNKAGFDITLKNSSDEVSLLALQGPFSRDTLSKLTDSDISEENQKFYSYQMGKVAGVDMIISRTGYTGESRNCAATELSKCRCKESILLVLLRLELLDVALNISPTTSPERITNTAVSSAPVIIVRLLILLFISNTFILHYDFIGTAFAKTLN
jgi:hypothetical protein